MRYLKAHCSEDPALLSDIVLVECAWVLEDVYEYSRAQIGEAIDSLLATAQLRAATAQLRAATAFEVGLALDLILVVLLAVGEAVVLLFPKRIYNGVNIGQIGFFETLQANEGRIPYIIVRPGRRAPWDAHALRARHPNCPNLDFSRSELQAML